MTKTIQHPDGRTGVEIEGENGSKLIFEPKPADPKTALARRAVASPAWRWMPRMLDSYGDTVIEVRAEGVFVASRHHGLLYQRLDAIPDLDDPATLGCLLALVREAWGDPFMCAVPYVPMDQPLAQALVAALEAAGKC